MTIQPFEIGVCSWSLQVKSVPELEAFCRELHLDVVQIACGDPHHASWEEGEDMPAAARKSGLRMSAAMLGFPGEDYTTPATIQKTGGLGDPALRPERIERVRWGVERTIQLGLTDLCFHAGFIPPVGAPERSAFLETLAQAASIAQVKGVHICFETGQEPAELLKRTLEEIKAPNIHVNFDPANMLLYDMGDPIKAVELLAPFIRSVHVKDAKRPRIKGEWGEEVPLGQGQANIPMFVRKLKEIGFAGPLVIEREAGDQKGRLRDVAHGVRYLKEVLSGIGS
ncbi:sugar phosphate isomerase/epimerase [bacterium]|nr:sugar phosphate isomerase/epimerase [bacterium]